MLSGSINEYQGSLHEYAQLHLSLCLSQLGMVHTWTREWHIHHYSIAQCYAHARM